MVGIMQTHQQETPKAEKRSGKSGKAQAKSDKTEGKAQAKPVDTTAFESIGERADEALNGTGANSLRAKTLEMWWTVGAALQAGHQCARAETGKSSGDEHEVKFEAFLKRHHLDDKHLSKNYRTNLVRCQANRGAIDKWLLKVKEETDYAKRPVNNPVHLWSEFLAAHPGFAEKNIFGETKKPKTKTKSGARHTVKPPREPLKAQVERLEKENNDLTRRTAQAEAAEETLKQKQAVHERRSTISDEERANPTPETIAQGAEAIIQQFGMVFAVQVAELILSMHVAKKAA